jgi:hypothetical protein
MNVPEEYTRSGEPWGTIEDEQLIKEYNIDMLAVMELSNIHKRMPGSIVTRLKHLKLITVRNVSRGYREYQQSELYKAIVAYNIQSRMNKDTTQKKKKTLQPMKIEDSDILQYSQIKEDIKEIKKDIGKILELIHAMYEFKDE